MAGGERTRAKITAHLLFVVVAESFQFDAARCFALTIYGSVFNGPINVVLYRTYVGMFGTGTASAVVLGVAADQLIWVPLIAIPMAYLFSDSIQAVLAGRTPSMTAVVEHIKRDWLDTVYAGWFVWVPIEAINMSLVRRARPYGHLPPTPTCVLFYRCNFAAFLHVGAAFSPSTMYRYHHGMAAC